MSDTSETAALSVLSEEQKEFLRQCDKDFADRFTDSDEAYVAVRDRPKPAPPIEDPWNPVPFRDRDGGFRDRDRYRHRDNYRDQHNYRDRDGGWRGNRYNNRDNYRYDRRQDNRYNAYRRNPYDRFPSDRHSSNY